MNTLCRECGKPAAPEYTDEHDGLCMACVHRDRYSHHLAMAIPNVNMDWKTGVTRVYIDHDMVQPQSTDPIRDAIDFFREVWPVALDALKKQRDVGGDS